MATWTATTLDWRFGSIVAPGFRYTFDGRDAMWLARALAGESTVQAAGLDGTGVFWAMVNRMAIQAGRPLARRGFDALPWPWRFADLLRAYCQPINPYWADRGDRWQIERRRRIASMTPDEAGTELVNFVWKLTTGRGPSSGRFTGIVDFGAPSCSECYSYHGPHEFCVLNCFWKIDGTRGWPEGTVRIAQPGTPVLLPLAFGAAAVAVALAFRGR